MRFPPPPPPQHFFIQILFCEQKIEERKKTGNIKDTKVQTRTTKMTQKRHTDDTQINKNDTQMTHK
jgi:hypothetical protein